MIPLSFHTVMLSAVGGILPALLWLWFWLHEDKRHPEPRRRIALTFLAGMGAVVLVFPLEKLVEIAFQSTILASVLGSEIGLICMLCLWALIEETMKYLAAYWAGFSRKDFDEPLDAVIYMITTALGFAALETALFLLAPLADGDITNVFITGNLRFLGAAVLHTLTSGIVGAFIALSFYKNRHIKRSHLAYGLVLAIVLHTLFNFFIMNSSNDRMFLVFSSVWAAVIILLVVFEKIKLMRPFNRFK